MKKELRDTLEVLKYLESNPTNTQNIKDLALIYGEFALKYYSPKACQKALFYNDKNKNLDILFGLICNKYGLYDKGASLFYDLLRHEPSAIIYFCLANSLSHLDTKKELATSYYLKSISLESRPEPHVNLAFHYFNNADFINGFRAYEKRKQLQNYKTPFSHINIKSESKNILIYFEQGFGDSIMFGRFLKHLDTKYNQYNLYCLIQHELKELFENIFTNITFISDLNILDAIYFKESFSLLSLPYILNISSPIDSMPFKILQHHPSKIGICANTSSPINKDKNIKKIALVKYAKSRFPDAEIIDFSSDNLKNLNVANFYQSFLLLSSVKYMFSIDSAILHLALSLGIESSVFLNNSLSWRYKNGFWYDKIHLVQMPHKDLFTLKGQI